MKELFYNAYAIAYYTVAVDMGIRKIPEFLEELHRYDYAYLPQEYRDDKKKFLSDVLYLTNYLVDKDKLDAEFPVVVKDLNVIGKKSDLLTLSDYTEIDLFFMIMRLRIVFSDNRDYVRMKLRTLLKNYGYKRRSEIILSHIQFCLTFYHIQPYLKGGEPCDIGEIDLDDMIIFREGL